MNGCVGRVGCAQLHVFAMAFAVQSDAYPIDLGLGTVGVAANMVLHPSSSTEHAAHGPAPSSSVPNVQS